VQIRLPALRVRRYDHVTHDADVSTSGPRHCVEMTGKRSVRQIAGSNALPHRCILALTEPDHARTRRKKTLVISDFALQRLCRIQMTEEWGGTDPRDNVRVRKRLRHHGKSQEHGAENPLLLKSERKIYTADAPPRCNRPSHALMVGRRPSILNSIYGVNNYSCLGRAANLLC